MSTVDLKTVRNKPDQVIIDKLEEMLALAKSGQLTELHYFYFIEDSYVKGNVFTNNTHNVHTAFGILMDLAMQYRDDQIENGK